MSTESLADLIARVDECIAQHDRTGYSGVLKWVELKEIVAALRAIEQERGLTNQVVVELTGEKYAALAKRDELNPPPQYSCTEPGCPGDHVSKHLCCPLPEPTGEQTEGVKE